MRKIIIAIIAIVTLFCAKAYAMQPTGQYFVDTDTIVIKGYCVGLRGERYVNIIAAECDSIDSINNDNIAYADSCALDQNDSYSFVFTLKKDFDKCKFWVKTSNIYEPIEVIKVLTDKAEELPAKAEILSPANIIASGARIKPRIFIISEQGNKTECDVYSLTSDSDCVSIQNGWIRGVTDGTSNIKATVQCNGDIYETEPLCITVKSKSLDDYAQLIGVIYKNGDIIVEGEDIVDADSITFIFDSDMPGLRVVSLSENDEEYIINGAYNSDERSYKIDLDSKLGLENYKFRLMSDNTVINKDIIVGCSVNINADDVMAVGEEYSFSISALDNNGEEIKPDEVNVYVNGLKTDNYVITPDISGQQTISSDITFKGYTKSILKTINVCNIIDIIPMVDKQSLNIGEQGKISVLTIGDNGQTVNAEKLQFTFSTSRKAKVGVSSRGVITGRENGSSIITVAYGELEKSFTVSVGIAASNTISGIYFDDTEAVAEINSHMSYRLCEYYTDGSKVPLENVLYNVSDNRLAEIDENGLLKAKSNGILTLTAVYEGKEYKKSINIIKNELPNIKVVMDSDVLIIGMSKQVKVICSNNIPLPKEQYKLFSSNSDIAKIDDGNIIGVNDGVCEIYAKIIMNNTEIISQRILVTVIEDGYSVIDDKFDDFSKMFDYDTRLQIHNNNIYTSGTNQRNAYIIYNVENARKIAVRLQKHETIEDEVLFIYASEDGENYELVSCLHSVGKTENGWNNDMVIADKISEGTKYIKFVIDGGEQNTQYVRLQNIIIESFKPIEVISAKILEENTDGNQPSNIVGRYAAIAFNRSINPDSLVNITVNDIEATGVYDIEKNIYTIKLPDISYEQYNISIKGVYDIFGMSMKKNISINLNTLDNSYSVINFDIKKMTGGAAKGNITLKNNSLVSKDYIIAYAFYNASGRLIGVKSYKTESVLPASENIITVAIETGENTRIFVWESMDSIIPIDKAISVLE